MAAQGNRGRHARPTQQYAGDQVDPFYDIRSELQQTQNSETSELDSFFFSESTNPPYQSTQQIDSGHYGVEDVSYYRTERYGARRRRSSVAKKVALCILAAVILYGAALATSGILMYRGIDGLRGDATTLQQDFLKGDYSAADKSLERVSSKIGILNQHLSSPLWAPITVVPFIGEDVRNARAISSSINELCGSLFRPMVDSLAASNSGPLIRDDKSFNADTLQICLKSLGDNNNLVSSAYNTISNLRAGRIDGLNRAQKQLNGIFAAVNELAGVSPQLAERIHWLLGAEGEQRTYLVVAQNNVEIRATGGYPGSLGPITVNNGKMEIGEFVAVTSLGRYDGHAAPVSDMYPDPPVISDEEKTVFGRRVSVVPGDMNYNPSFARASESWKYTWEVSGRGNIDGVVAIDPIFLQSLLQLFGEIVTEDGTAVNGKNAASLLMYDTYRTRDSEQQDAFFVEVAECAFDQVITHLDSVKPLPLANLIWDMCSNRRLLLWMNDSVSQDALAAIGWTGELSSSATDPKLGVFINDDSWGKMSWYLSLSTEIGEAMLNNDGTYSYQVKTTLRNNLTEAEELELPDYVAGHNNWCRTRGDTITWIYLVAPKDGSISNVEVTGFFTDPSRTTFENYGRIASAGMNEASYEGYDIWYGLTQINRGESTVVTYTVTTSSNASPLGLYTTPMAQEIAGW